MPTKEILDQIKVIDAYKKAGKATLVMLCDPYNLPEFHRLLIEEVVLTISDKPGEPSDIYQPPGSKNYALHLSALERLGSIAGIEWIPSVTDAKTITDKTIHYIATGFYVREYGKRVSIQGEGLSDLDVIKEDLQAKYEADAKKYDKDEAYVKYCVDRDYRAKRRKRLQLAAAEARAQVYRKLLALGGTYPKALFNHPIVIIRCVVAPDFKDPETVKLLRNASVNAALGIYGPPQGLQIGLPAPENAVSEEGDYTGDDTETIIPEVEPGNEAPEDKEEQDPQRADFITAGDDAQRAALSQLIGLKGYELPKGLTLEKMSETKRLAFYDHLMAIEDDDVPF